MRLWIASRIMARTTLNLDPTVLRELKQRGAQEGRSIGAVASDLLAGALRGQQDDPSPHGFRWSAGQLGAPRVDLDDAEAVRRALES